MKNIVSKFNKLNYHKFGLTFSLIGISLCMGMLPSYPTSSLEISPKIDPFNPIFASNNIVPDNDLGTMRGRFVTNGVVQFFGIEMISIWRAQDGSVLSSGINFTANLKDPSNAQFTYQPFAQVTPGSGTTSNNNNNQIGDSGNGGINNVNGITQSVQVAGSNNNLTNNMSIDVLGPNSTPNSSSAFTNVPDQTIGTTTTSTSGNMVAMATSAGDVLETQLVIPGQGVVTQIIRHTDTFNLVNTGIGGIGLSSGTGIAQQIGINSNNNTVQNSLKMQVQMNSAAALQQASQQTAILLQSISKVH